MGVVTVLGVPPSVARSTLAREAAQTEAARIANSQNRNKAAQTRTAVPHKAENGTHKGGKTSVPPQLAHKLRRKNVRSGAVARGSRRTISNSTGDPQTKQ